MDPEKLKAVLDAQDTARDQMYAEQAPVGRFSAPRINALCKEVNKVLKLIKAPYEAEQIEGPLKDKTPLPPGLMKGLTLVKSMIEEYNKEADAPLKSFEITQLTDDAALALAGVAITELLRSADFKAFLKENDGNYAELIEFVHNRGYLLDHAKSSHAEGRFVFDWMSNLLTSCIPGWETIDTSGSIYIELEDTDRFRIGLEVNIYNESSEIPNEFS